MLANTVDVLMLDFVAKGKPHAIYSLAVDYGTLLTAKKYFVDVPTGDISNVPVDLPRKMAAALYQAARRTKYVR